MKPFKKVLMVCGGITLLLLTIVALGYALTDIPSAAASLKENEAKARAAGLFITPKEYIDSITVPDSENAARIMAPVLKKYEVKYKEAKFEDTSKKTIDRPLVLAAYTDLAKEWKQIDEAANFKYCIFPRDRTVLAAIRYEEYAYFRGLVRLLLARAMLAIADRDIATTEKAWQRAAVLSLVADDEPNMSALFCRVSCSSLLYESIRVGLREHGDETSWRRAALGVLEMLDHPHDFFSAFRFEHVNATQSINRFFDKQTLPSSDEDYPDIFEEQFRWMTNIPRMRAATLSRVHDISQGVASRLENTPFDTNCIEVAGKWADGHDYDSPSYLVARFAMPMIIGVDKSIARDYARRNTLMQAIKLLENPTAKDLPLKGRYALDCDGKPLRLIRKDNKLIIYCLGPNDADDGGILERPKNSTSRDYDFGVAIPK